MKRERGGGKKNEERGEGGRERGRKKEWRQRERERGGGREKQVVLQGEELCCILGLGDSTVSEFYMPTFRNNLFHLLMRCKKEEQPG